MEDFSGSLFGLSNLPSTVVEVGNRSFYTIQVLVIASSTAIAGNNILGAREELRNQPHGPSEYTSSGHQNSAGKQSNFIISFPSLVAIIPGLLLSSTGRNTVRRDNVTMLYMRISCSSCCSVYVVHFVLIQENNSFPNQNLA